MLFFIYKLICEEAAALICISAGLTFHIFKSEIITMRGYPMQRRFTTKDLTQKKLKENLIYDPEIGIWIWKNPSNIKMKNGGGVAGNIDKAGYRSICINGKPFRSGRLVFLYMLGYFPKYDVDHKNRIRDDDRWENLREITNRCNAMNTGVRKKSISGIKGVQWDKRQKSWRITITINGKLKRKRTKHLHDAARIRFEFEKKYNFLKYDPNSSAFRYLKENNLLQKKDKEYL